MSLQDNALTTVDKAKGIIGISDDDVSQDSLIELFINAASDKIETFCKRIFGITEYTNEKYSGHYDEYLIIRQFPIIEVTSLKINDIEVDINNYDIMSEHGMLFNGCRWPQGERNISIDYKAGYVLPKDSSEDTPSNLPAAIETACLFLVKSLFNDDINKESERIGDYSVTYSRSQSQLPNVVKSLAAPYVGRVV